MTTTDWTQDEINALMDERDEAVRQRDEALAQRDSLQRQVWEQGDRLKEAAAREQAAKGMVEMHVDDAAAARLLWRQSEAACAQMHAQRDEAQQMVTEMRAILLDRAREQAAKARGEVSGLSGRWCLTSERDEALARAEKAEARERERTNERDNYGQELDKAKGMVEMHVDDAAAARLLWRQSEAACAQMHDQRDAAIRERDELGRRSAADFQGLEEIRSETSRQLNAALDELDAAIKERDEAQRLVAEMRAALIIGRDIVIETSSNNRHNKFVEDAYDVIEASAHVAGR